MEAKIVWLFVFVALYWAYCIFWGVKGALTARTASDYFIANRGLAMWVFVLAATATSFSGWTFMGHPGLVYRDGFQYAYASFYAVTIPFTGVMFLKRQWMLGKRFGYVTPGEMLSDYFQGDGIRILTVIVALLFSVPYLGVQLGASGYLFNVLTTTDANPNGLLSEAVGMWVLSAVVFIYVASGGLRAVAYVDTMQCILLALGIIVTGIVAINLVGGFGALNEGLAELANTSGTKWGTTEGRGGGDYSGYFAIPGVIQFTAGLGKETPVGGLWTGIMVLTYMFALMGIQSAPAFTMWAFGNRDPKPFAPQQVWASALGIGLILFSFTAFQGMGAHLLGADPVANKNASILGRMIDNGTAKVIEVPDDGAAVMAALAHGDVPVIGLGVADAAGDTGLQAAIMAGSAAIKTAETAAEAAAWATVGIARLTGEAYTSADAETKAQYETAYAAALAELIPPALAGAQLVRTPLPSGSIVSKPDSLVPNYFNQIADSMPWLVGLLAVCALAAMQSTGAAYMSTAGGMITRDLYKRFLNPAAGHTTQKLFGRIGVGVIVVSALLVATFSRDALVLLGGLAVAFGFQMWPALASVCWFPWLTRQGVTWGLAAGLIGVIFTENFGAQIAGWFGIDLPWGRWPLTIHSAGWGMLLNLAVAIPLSALTQNAADREHRMKYHNFLREHASLSPSKRSLVPVAWIITIVWFFFGIGPGAVIGNDLFGAPNAGLEAWTFGMPSIWVWQIIFLLLGVFMMWFLAYKMEMSTLPEKEVEALVEDIGDVAAAPAGE